MIYLPCSISYICLGPSVSTGMVIFYARQKKQDNTASGLLKEDTCQAVVLSTAFSFSTTLHCPHQVMQTALHGIYNHSTAVCIVMMLCLDWLWPAPLSLVLYSCARMRLDAFGCPGLLLVTSSGAVCLKGRLAVQLACLVLSCHVPC